MFVKIDPRKISRATVTSVGTKTRRRRSGAGGAGCSGVPKTSLTAALPPQ